MEGTGGKGGEGDTREDPAEKPDSSTQRPQAERPEAGRPRSGAKLRRDLRRRLQRRLRPESKPAPAPPPGPVTTGTQEAKPEKDPSSDLWFRGSTRIRAAGYWLREKSQQGVRTGRPTARRVGAMWKARSLGERIGIGAAAGLLFLVLLVRIVPLPGVPCGISVKECPPEQQSFDFAPADALLYAHLTLDRDSEQFENASDALGSLSDLRTILAAELPPALPTPSGGTVDISLDALPWAEGDLAMLLVAGPGDRSLQAFVVGVGDRAGADEFLAEVAPAGEARAERQGDAELSVYPSGFAAAFAENSLVFGDERAVRDALRAQQDDASSLGGNAQVMSLYEELPETRFAEVYLSRSGVQRLLAGRSGAATQLETFVDYGATQGIAAAAVAEDDGIAVELISDLEPELLARNPSFFSELPEFEPELDGEAGVRSLGYVGVGEVGTTLSDLLERAGGAAGSLRRLAARLRKQAGVDPLSDLLPALGGQAALIAEPTDGPPFASLVVEDVDEERASQALARLQRPLLRSLGTSGGSRVLRFEDSEVDGVAVRSVQVSPTVNLSYAVFDGMLVVSTDPAGIEQVRSDGDSLADSEAYGRATSGLPDRVSALVFLNLDELFGQVTRTDLVEDPFFANLSILFDNATSTALAVVGNEDEVTTELFLVIDQE